MEMLLTLSSFMRSPTSLHSNIRFLARSIGEWLMEMSQDHHNDFSHILSCTQLQGRAIGSSTSLIDISLNCLSANT